MLELFKIDGRYRIDLIKRIDDDPYLVMRRESIERQVEGPRVRKCRIGSINRQF